MAVPKVLIGCPVAEEYAYAFEEVWQALQKITYPSCDILFVDNSRTEGYFRQLKARGLPVIRGAYFPESRKRMIHNRNLLREKTLDGGYDYHLCMDADIVLPPFAVDELLKPGKSIVSGVYFREMTSPTGQVKAVPMIYVPAGEGKCTYVRDVFTPRVLKVVMCGLGCVLIHRSVLEKVRFSYDRGFEDQAFCKDAQAAGFEVFANTKVLCKHLYLRRDWHWKEYQIKRSA